MKIKRNGNSRRWRTGTAILVAVLMVAAALPVAADATADRAREWLAGQLDVAADTIRVDGGMETFPELDVTVWMGRYQIGDMLPEPAGDDGDDTVMTEPAKTPESGSAESDALPPDRPEGMIGGLVILDVATDTFLRDQEADDFLMTLYDRQNAIWEELAAEAGPIAVPFYSTLTRAAPTDRFEVVLQVLHVETEAMQEALQALEEEYSDVLGRSADGIAVVEKEETSGGGEGSVSVDTALAPTDWNPEIAERLEEFQQRWDEIWQQGYEMSLPALQAELDALGVTYTVEDYLIKAEMTAEQILSLRDSAHVASIMEEGMMYIMEDLAAEGSLISRQDEKNTAADGAGGEDGAPPAVPAATAGRILLPIGIGAAVLALGAGGFLLLRARRRHAADRNP